MRSSSLFFGSLLLSSLLGCSSDEAPVFGANASGAGGAGAGGGGGVCIPGAQLACACPDGGPGVQVCLADGSSLGPCQCGGAGGGGGDGGNGGSGGSGGGGLCQPGSTVPCYGGPAGTEDVGVCLAGLATCVADGSGYGPCVGEVLPSVDDCMTAADEDCDGTPALCPGGLWAKSFGDSAHVQGGTEVALDALGNVYLLARMAGSADFGGGNLVATGLQQIDVVIAKFDPQGNHLWSKRFGDAQYQEPTGIAVDAQGNVAVVIMVTGAIDFGAGTLFAQDGDLGVAKFDPQGNLLWGGLYGDATYQGPTEVAIDSTGAIVLGGDSTYNSVLDLGNGNIPGTGNMFLVKLDAGGSYVWGKRFGSSKANSFLGLGIGPNDDIYFGGRIADVLDFGAGPIGSANDKNVLVVKANSSGVFQWAKSFGDLLADQQLEQLAVAPSGNVALIGTYHSKIDFGGPQLPDVGTTVTNLGAFTAILDANGDHVASAGYFSGNQDAGTGVAVDALGNSYFYGFFSGPIDFGEGVVPTNGVDLFLVKRNAAGVFLDAATFGASGQNYSSGVATGPGGVVALTGAFGGTLDFGTGPLVGVSDDIFLAKLAL